MKKNKILVVANGIIGKDPGLSGGDVRFLELTKYWLKFGQEVHLLSSETGRKMLKNFGIKIPVHVIPNISESSERLSYIFRTLQTIFYFPQSLKSFDEGIVYSVNDSVFDVIPAVKLKLRHPKTIKWAAVVHWVPPFPPWKRKKSTVLNSILFYINVRISIWLANKFADVILPVSIPTSQQLRGIHVQMGKVFPVKCGVNYDDIRAVSKTVKVKEYDAVFMKRIQPVKGVFDLIDIWVQVVKKRKDSKLLIIGDEGNDAQEVKKMIEEKGLEKNIEFAGYIFDFKKKISRLSEAKVFILPSYEENWAIAIGEAMAAGLPVLAYDLKELLPIWDSHAVWIPLGDTTFFAKKILEVTADNKKMKDMIDDNYPFIKDFTWESIAKNELKIISNSI